jgi:hypothetical protein
MIVRNYEFDEEMLKLFIERLCDVFGGPYDCLNRIKDMAYSGIDIDLSGESSIYYESKIKELSKTNYNIVLENNGLSKENNGLLEENNELIEENDRYIKDIMKYEKVLSTLGYSI